MQHNRIGCADQQVWKYTFIVFFCCLISYYSYAQSAAEQEKTFCDPSVFGQPRPKFLQITRGTSTSFPVQNISQFEGIDNGNAQVVDNSTLEIKVNAPVLLKPGLKIFTGVKYFQEDFEFNNIANQEVDLYFQNLHRKSLRSVRGTLYGIKSFRGNAYLATRFSASLNGDIKSSEEDADDFLNFSVAALLGWKKNESFAYGVGLAYTNMFGVNRIYPVVGLEKSFNQHWGFEALLPKTASIRYTTTDRKNNFYSTLCLDGGAYRINLPPLMPNQDLILQRNEVQLKLNYEREIYDWIWFGIAAGVRKYIGADLTLPGDRQTVVYDTQFGTNAFVNFSLFLVPPRKLLERF